MARNVKHNYSDVQAFTTGTSATFGAVQVYRLNSLYDPNQTGVGSQPYGRDTLATIYDRYRVRAVTIELIMVSPKVPCVAIGVLLRNPTQTSTLLGAQAPVVREWPNARVFTLTDTGSQRQIFKHTFNMWEVAGVTRLQFDADYGIFDALSTNNPDASYGTCYLEIAALDQDGGSAVPVCNVTTNLTFHTDWYNRKTLAQS